MADGSGASDANANAQLLQELDELSHSLYQSYTARRTASLILPRSSTSATSKPAASNAASGGDSSRSQSMPHGRRMSMSPWRSRPKSQNEPHDDDSGARQRPPPPSKQQSQPGTTVAAETADKKGIWNWKPMRALSHIAMQRLGCLFSVEVLAVRGLPASMYGLRLSVAVRKKETKEGALQTTPARVTCGSADFEETLFIRCHVYCTGGAGTGKPVKFESRLFLISTVAIDAPELDLGRSSVDLSQLIKESMERRHEGPRARPWDAKFPLSGKGKGGELLVKLSFQIIEDGSIGLFNQDEGGGSSNKLKDSSFSFARKKSKSSFVVMSPKITRQDPSLSPREEASAIDSKEIEPFSLDDVQPSPPPPSPPPVKKLEPELKDGTDFLEFEVVEKGVELQVENEEHVEEEEKHEADSAEVAEETSTSKEVVKEVVHGSEPLTQFTELHTITPQIKVLKSKMIGEEPCVNKLADEEEMKLLDVEEDAVTREFLQMLKLEDERAQMLNIRDHFSATEIGLPEAKDGEKGTYISDLGKGLSSVVQTRDGGYLAAMNPFNVQVTRTETPKLAMQISKPFILGNQNLASGLEVFQRLAAAGSEELAAKLESLTSMDELTGKTAEQIAFEGMASAIISGRNTEVASSSAAKTVALLKIMDTALSEGRKDRILTGIWNVRGEPVAVEDIVAFALQKMEAMAVEALKIQAGMAEEDAPFDAPPLLSKADQHPLDSTIAPENWEEACIEANSVTLIMVVQLREPLRRYETVGAPSIAVIQAERADDGGDEGKFNVASLHVGGLKLLPGGRRSIWDGEKQRLTAMRWLMSSCGSGKTARKKSGQSKGGQDVLWSITSRILADMWLNPMRNPDVKII